MSTIPLDRLKQHGQSNLPPFGIIEKTQAKIQENRVFATTTSWLIGKNQLVIHLSIGTVMRWAIRNHAQKSISNNKAKSCKLQNHQQTK